MKISAKMCAVTRDSRPSTIAIKTRDPAAYQTARLILMPPGGEEKSIVLGLPQVRTNAAAQGSVLEDVARPDSAGLSLLRDAAEAMRLSARGYHRVLRVARTLADLDGADKIGRLHLAEALSYRALAEDVRSAA